MSRVDPAGARRPSRVKVRPGRPAVAPARLVAFDSRPMRIRRARRLSAVRMRDQSSLRIHNTGHQWPLRIELLRAVFLIAGTILAVLVVLPSLLEFAGAAVR